MKWIVMAVVFVAGCEQSNPVAAPTTSPAPTTLDQALSMAETRLYPASDGGGDYLVTSEGIWLLRGQSAVRVKEADRLPIDLLGGRK